MLVLTLKPGEPIAIGEGNIRSIIRMSTNNHPNQRVRDGVRIALELHPSMRAYRMDEAAEMSGLDPEIHMEGG